MKRDIVQLRKQRQNRLMTKKRFIGLNPNGINNIQRRNDHLHFNRFPLMLRKPTRLASTVTLEFIGFHQQNGNNTD